MSENNANSNHNYQPSGENETALELAEAVRDQMSLDLEAERIKIEDMEGLVREQLDKLNKLLASAQFGLASPEANHSDISNTVSKILSEMDSFDETVDRMRKVADESLLRREHKLLEQDELIAKLRDEQDIL